MKQALDADFLAAVVENVAHPIFVKDRAFRFVLVNRALCEAMGHPREAFLGRTDYDLFPAAEADFFRLKDQELFRSESTVVIEEETITDRHGGVHVLATTKVPMRDASGAVTHLVGIINDITLLKDAQERLKSANEELERRVAERTDQLAQAQAELLRKERLAVLGQLAGGVAHQLRNPLASLINAAALLRRADLEGVAREMVEVVDAESWRANRIVEDLLSYARIRSPAKEEVSLAELVHRVTSAVPSGRVRVELHTEEDVAVPVDPQQLSEAIRNLVTNAVEAATPEGHVRVHTDVRDALAVVRIEDDGPGISEETRKHLFEPLFTTKAYGLGLGLTTARSLVENQGGKIHCVRASVGACFEVHLPRVVELVEEPSRGG